MHHGFSICRLATIIALAASALSACSQGAPPPPVASTPPPVASPPPPPASTVSLAATLDAQPLGDPINTETLFLVRHRERLFAATGQWTAPTAELTGGQVLVKDAFYAPWREIVRSATLRLSALASFRVPARYDGGVATDVLLTFAREEARVGAPITLLWLLNEEAAFDGRFTLSSGADGDGFGTVRAYGAHDDDATFAFFTSVEDLGILRGVWNVATRTIEWETTPERPAAPGDPIVKSFTSCNGALYASLGRTLLRRNDGALAPGAPRWVAVHVEPSALGSGLRGLTCTPTSDFGTTLLAAVEGPGTILRWNNIPSGNLDAGATLTPTVEVGLREVIREGLAQEGVVLPTNGVGAVGYVIAAYNDMLPLDDIGRRHAFGLEWAYEGTRACPQQRICTEAGDYDAAACFVVRTDGVIATYELRCLSGDEFQPRPDGVAPHGPGEGFVAIRTIAPSPFATNELYFGGFDANGNTSRGTAWTAVAPIPQ